MRKILIVSVLLLGACVQRQEDGAYSAAKDVVRVLSRDIWRLRP